MTGDGGRFTDARLGQAPADVVLTHSLGPKLEDELRLLDSFVQVDLAHTVMLAEQGIISPEQAKGILSVLREIEHGGREALAPDPSFGSLLLQVERYLEHRLGEDVAGRMHTGRSRNDQSAAVHRLATRDGLLSVLGSLLRLQDVVLDLAARHTETYMPGYTHLQHAQPTTFGHYLMRHYFTFERDQQRLEAAFTRANLSALGGAAMTGTSWPIDRRRVAELLGHEGLVENAYDAGVFARDYPAENAAVLSLLLSGVGRLAGDLYVWSTWEFRMIELADALAGTSSIMPQKKNPHAIERIRGLCGSSLGWFPATLGTLRSASASDLDLHFAPDLTPEMVSTTVSALELMSATLGTVSVDAGLMRERSSIFWSTATNLADELVRRAGISFRTAHRVVGRLVRNAVEAGMGPADVTGSLLDQAAQETIGRHLGLGDEVVRGLLDPVEAVRSLVTPGSARPEAVRESVEEGRSRQREHGAWLQERSALLERAKRDLTAAIDRLTG